MNRRSRSTGVLKALNRLLCILGAAGVFAGVLLESNPLFLVGVGVGILGYLGVRRELGRDLEGEDRDGPEPRR